MEESSKYYVFRCMVFQSILFSACAAPQREVYDFVIVGGGTAGCVLAARLTESGNHSVLLLEAGEVPHPDLEIPALSTRNYEKYSRMYKSVPQEHVGLSSNRTIQLISARTLGGGTSINGMLWNRGNPHDIDAWAKVTNDPSWNYSNMLKYFKKVENYSGDFPSDHHGAGGPITISRPKYSPGLEEWLDAGKSLGYPVADPNGPQQVSYTPLEFSKLRGRRQSAYTQYLRPALSRPNLRVITAAEATKILFYGKIATGVKYRLNGTGEGVAIARKEVIISAGTFETVALLLRSGIGPKNVLRNAGIPQIHELSVGANLQDHPLVALPFILNNKSVTFDPDTDLNPESWATYNHTGDGPYSTWRGVFGQAFLKSSEREESPNIQIYWVANAKAVSKRFGSYSEDIRSNLEEGEVVAVSLVSLGLPRSRGSVALDPKNPNNLPMIDLKYFSNPKDMEVMIAGIKAVLDTFEKSPSFQKLGARFYSGSTKLCAETDCDFGSDEYWKCYIKHRAMYGAHGAGSCKMGSGPEDKEAVVDPSLRIIGLRDIRVVDASIMPTITNANIQAPVYAIAEKGAELILETWK